MLKFSRLVVGVSLVGAGVSLTTAPVCADPPEVVFDSSWSSLHESFMDGVYDVLFSSPWSGEDPAFHLAEPVFGPVVVAAVNESGLPLVIEFGSMALVSTDDLPDAESEGVSSAAWARAALEAGGARVFVDGLLSQTFDEEDGLWIVEFLPGRNAMTAELLWEWEHGPSGPELVGELLFRFQELMQLYQDGVEPPDDSDDVPDDGDDAGPPDDDPEPSLVEQCRSMLLLSLEVCRQEMEDDLRDCLEETSDEIAKAQRRLDQCVRDVASVSLECLLTCGPMTDQDERVQCLLACLRNATRMVDMCERERRRLRALRSAQYDCFNNGWISLQACAQSAYLAYVECMSGANGLNGDG